MSIYRVLLSSKIYDYTFKGGGILVRQGRFLKYILSLALITPFAYQAQSQNVNAASAFAGKEDTYYKLCSSKKLSKSKQQTCQEFNTYLKGRSKDLKSQIASTKKSVQSTKSSITTMQKKITSLNSQINTTKKRIAYVKVSIANTEKALNKKESTLKNRIYAAQATTNSNSYVSYLFGADSFSDFFSRVSTVGDITSYENDLMDQINKTKANLKTQKQTLTATQANLTSARRQSKVILSQYNEKLKEQEATLRKSTGDLGNNEESIQQIAKNLADMKEAERKAAVAAAKIAAQKKALAEAKAKAEAEAREKARIAAQRQAAAEAAAKKAQEEAEEKRRAAEEASAAKKAAAEAAAKKAQAEAAAKKKAAQQAASAAQNASASSNASSNAQGNDDDNSSSSNSASTSNSSASSANSSASDDNDSSSTNAAASSNSSSNSSNSSSDDTSSKSQSSSSSSSDDSSSDDSSSAKVTNASVSGDDIALKALSKRGAPYVWGASGPSTFDCSGLVWWAHAQCGINFGRTDTRGLSSMGSAVSYGNLQPGDVLIFSSNGSYSGIHHTGIYIGNGMMVHAPHSGATVSVVTVSSGYYRNQFYTARRLY